MDDGFARIGRKRPPSVGAVAEPLSTRIRHGNSTADEDRLADAAIGLLQACKSARSLLRNLGGTNHDPEYSQLVAALAAASPQPKE